MGGREVVVGVQLMMLLADLLFNTVDVLMYKDHMALLMIYILQGTNLALCIIVLVISFSSTFVFQAGLITLLLRRFSPTLFISLYYVLASIALHSLTLSARWNYPGESPWTLRLTALYAAQKIGAAFFYASYKRTAFLLCDPRFHADNKWLRNQLRMQAQ